MTAAPVTWRDVEVDGAVVRVVEAGDPDREVLLFLHGWGLSPRAYADDVALVVQAMLERRQRGQALRLPRGSTLADILPVERRSASRLPRQRRPS